MKLMNLGLSKKIWLSIGFLIFGYFLSMIFGFVLGRQMEGRMIKVSEYLYGPRKTEMMDDSSSTTKQESYYFMGTYRFNKWLEAGSYYSINYPDRSGKDVDRFKAIGLPDHGAGQKDAALFVRFDINNNWCVKLEGHQVNGTAQVLAVDNPTRSKENWGSVALKVTFSF
jgi:hypothetical protein